MNPIIVQKYGGSSLANSERIKAVASRIIDSEPGKRIVVVVSAMGDTTDNLIAMAHELNVEPDDRELALLLSTGEIISCALLAMAIRALGSRAVSLSGGQAGIRTDMEYSRARIVSVDPVRIIKELSEDKIVIVAGFQGITTEMDITTLGRGGSDTTAVALAAVLGAEVCEIYTDVEGIYTADPRVVSNARKLKEISYDEMLELAAHGAKMHPRSIEMAALYNVPIKVLSSFVHEPGTIIH